MVRDALVTRTNTGMGAAAAEAGVKGASVAAPKAGQAVAAALRTLPELSHARLIALSGHGQTEDQRRALAAGFDLHLIKPIDFDELRQLLEVVPLPREA